MEYWPHSSTIIFICSSLAWSLLWLRWVLTTRNSLPVFLSLILTQLQCLARLVPQDIEPAMVGVSESQ